MKNLNFAWGLHKWNESNQAASQIGAREIIENCRNYLGPSRGRSRLTLDHWHHTYTAPPLNLMEERCSLLRDFSWRSRCLSAADSRRSSRFLQHSGPSKLYFCFVTSSYQAMRVRFGGYNQTIAFGFLMRLFANCTSPFYYLARYTDSKIF